MLARDAAAIATRAISEVSRRLERRHTREYRLFADGIGTMYGCPFHLQAMLIFLADEVVHMSPSSQSGLRDVVECAICASTASRPVAERNAYRCAVKICTNCGHLFASPAVDPSTLSSFYDHEFRGDSAAPSRLQDGAIPEHDIVRENQRARDWALPIIERYLDVKDLSILDIRSRTGALAEALTQRGAKVVGIDPFGANLDYARSMRTVGEMLQVPIMSWSSLTLEEESFDAATALTIHTLAHLPTPRPFLDRLYRLLRPGGLAFFDEKDIFQPASGVARSVLDSGFGHYHHFTADSLVKLFLSAGFDIVECDQDPTRKSAVRHVRVVARRPVDAGARGSPMPIEFACDVEERISLLLAADVLQRKIRRRNQIKRKIKSAIRTFSTSARI